MSDPKDGPGQSTLDSGLSQFLARVLGQLTLGAWLPAGLLVSVGTLTVQFAVQGSVDLARAVRDLLSDKWTFVILAVPVLVLATLVTQAFSFEAIRTLEGYWTRRNILSFATTRLVNRHLRRKHSVHNERISLSHQAFLRSRAAWLDAGFSPSVLNALEKSSLDQDNAQELSILTDQERGKMNFLNWRSRCAPSDMARIDDLSRIEEDYPADHRVLPTRLGNIMRSTEDRLRGARGDVEGFALRRREAASPRVQLQHDQFRTRLDMYCTLVFVSLLLAGASSALFAWSAIQQPGWRLFDVVWSVAIVCALLMLAWTSYVAAIASARGYLTALVHMDEPSGSELTPQGDRSQDTSS